MKERVLVVDDDRLVADTLCLVFRANGYESEAVYSAAEGFALAQSFAPNLVLCDVTMPGESGLELAARVQSAMPQTRLLMLTGSSRNAAEVRAQSRRLNRPLRLLSKPCRPDDLLRETRPAADRLTPGRLPAQHASRVFRLHLRRWQTLPSALLP